MRSFSSKTTLFRLTDSLLRSNYPRNNVACFTSTTNNLQGGINRSGNSRGAESELRQDTCAGMPNVDYKTKLGNSGEEEYSRGNTAEIAKAGVAAAVETGLKVGEMTKQTVDGVWDAAKRTAESVRDSVADDDERRQPNKEEAVKDLKHRADKHVEDLRRRAEAHQTRPTNMGCPYCRQFTSTAPQFNFLFTISLLHFSFTSTAPVVPAKQFTFVSKSLKSHKFIPLSNSVVANAIKGLGFQSEATMRKVLRAEICASNVLSDLNQSRSDVIEKAYTVYQSKPDYILRIGEEKKQQAAEERKM